ncbi:Protein of unknown function [Bacillus cytotoxicus]|uniref:Uncharacterized protein n=1 Tax=Bacillus cytotoxicus TaxID=580165 RepID=A0AAX2CFD9_9BACI|nr:Protein of unknown function [Bacillus cytotoxicus]
MKLSRLKSLTNASWSIGSIINQNGKKQFCVSNVMSRKELEAVLETTGDN